MAGTILSTPALGASDWSGWITQQGLTDRGFLRVSLTNMSDTTASSIASGGVLECAGSIYSFTETAISLASGTASASTAVYFYVIPSAGGTTCTIEMDSTAPTWRDDYQGFYASAASTTRVIGGCYIGTALGSYYLKWLYTPERVADCLTRGATRPWITQAHELGEWNMDATANISVAPNLPLSAGSMVRSIDIIIYTDGGPPAGIQPLWRPAAGTSGGYYLWSTAFGHITIYRTTGGAFDNVNFDGTASTMPNRGYLFITYEA